MKNSDIGRIGEANNPFFYEQFRENGGPHGEEGHIGMSSPVAGAAMAFDLYCRRYGKDRELLSAIPLTFRRHALMTPDAVAQKPMTFSDYQSARLIVEPLRLFDCSLVGDGAVCPHFNRARDRVAQPTGRGLDRRPGHSGGPRHFHFRPPRPWCRSAGDGTPHTRPDARPAGVRHGQRSTRDDRRLRRL